MINCRPCYKKGLVETKHDDKLKMDQKSRLIRIIQNYNNYKSKSVKKKEKEKNETEPGLQTLPETSGAKMCFGCDVISKVCQEDNLRTE